MGGSSGRCTGRECCGIGGPDAAQLWDGKSLFTLDGLERLPDGAACLHVSSFGVEPPIPIIVQNMMMKGDRAEDFRSLCGRLLEFGIGPPPDLEALLIEFVPRFQLHSIDTYLTHPLDDEGSVAAKSSRWFIFVDREENTTYEPPDANKASKVKSMMNRLRPSKQRYELEETSKKTYQFSICEDGRVDFSGYWKELVYEGDMDSFLKDVGWSRISRRIGKAFNYGVGRNEQVIDHQGNHLAIKMITPSGEFINTVIIGGGTQKVTGADGRRLSLNPVWVDDGHAVLTEQWTSGAPRVRVKRYLRRSGTDKEMVLEMISPGQFVAKRIFVNITT